ncbi:MAG TPA: alpha/beta hydrolase [Acidimicrobiales bacterium]
MPSEELQNLMVLLRANPSWASFDLETSRAELDALGSVLPVPEGVATTEATLAGRPACWYAAPDADDRVLLYLHGGGYVSGSLASHAGLCGRLAVATGGRVVALDYRLGPEHRFPAAVDDATAAWRELLADGVDSGRAAIAGDSAGGGLTMATLVALRDAADHLPAAAMPISPWTDLANRGASHQERAGRDPMLAKEHLDEMAALYLDSANPLQPLASPIDADLRGLPPTLVIVGSEEVLFDDSTVLVDRLHEAGVEATLLVGDGAFHVYPAAAGMPEAEAAVAAMADFWSAHTA